MSISLYSIRNLSAQPPCQTFWVIRMREKAMENIWFITTEDGDDLAAGGTEKQTSHLHREYHGENTSVWGLVSRSR